MLRPGIHLSNAIGVTDADLDICQRWAPMSLLEAMENIIEGDFARFMDAWRRAGEPEVVLRRYYTPQPGTIPRYELHARESCALARKCIASGIPAGKIMLKPFNEPNMPAWAQWEGFGDKPEQIEQYGVALSTFIDVAKNELPEVRIGGPHCTVGNHDVKFPNDPPGYYYYHGPDMSLESSPCGEALQRLDVHFVHCYALNPGEYDDRAHGLRFVEYERYLPGKPIYNVEAGCAINSQWLYHENVIRGEETVAYLKLLGDNYPEVKGIAFFIGGDRSWDAFRHSEDWSPQSHRPVVYKVEDACHEEPPPPPPPDPPQNSYTLLKGLLQSGIPKVVDLRPQIETFSNLPYLFDHKRQFSATWYLMLHHTADERYRDPIEIAKYHVLTKEGPKDPSIPYHFLVDGGRLYFTGRLVWDLWHCGEGYMSKHSVGIGVIGDLTQRRPTDTELSTLRRLVYSLEEFYGQGWGKIRQLCIVPHNWHWPETQCPGSLTEAFCWEGDWPVPPFWSDVAFSD